MVDPWLKQLREYPFPIVELHRDVPLPAICHIFEKVNSTGKPLTVFELCTAILWSKGVHLNELWRATQQRFHEEYILRMQGELDGTHFLQLIALLDSLDRKLASPNTRIAVSCRRDELTNLTADTVNRWWQVAEDAYREASFFMEEEGIVAPQILPYSTILVPLAGIIGSIKSRGDSNALGVSREKLSQWYWCSVFSGRYSGTVDTNAGKDTEQVFHWVNGDKEPDVVRDFSFQANRLEQAKSIRGVLYKGILCLLARNNARDFSGGGKLTTNLYKKTSQHHHHIFPRSAVKKLGVADDRTESIINMTLISAAANLRISGQLPSQYVAKMRADLGEANANEILLSHAIVPGLLATDDWDQFMLARRELLLNLIVDATGKPAVPFSDGREAPIELHIQTMAADIESIETRLRDLVAFHLREDRSRINGYELNRVKERYESTRKRTPGMKEFHQIGVREILDHADLRILESIIKSKDNWSIFTDCFGDKAVFESRFTGLANVRNALAHNRQPNEFEIGDGRIAALWFNRVLDNALIQQQIEADDQVDDEPEDESQVDDAVDLQSIIGQHYPVS
ncbi:MAG: hypothetical protein M9909_13030 [Thermomicrobiales bacterium]|nr:hypothetical protein [Thermomicrobiales bacterium]